ncbi:WxL domain-containing protein, partial [Enterococcus ureasiticus]
AWANSAYTQEKSPQLSKDIIQLNAPGTTFPVATADQGQGKGTWIISFGASAENAGDQASTLFPKVDEKNQPILDENFENQQVQGNKAIFLSVPDAVKIHPVQYQTELTWILAELP